MVNQNKIFSFKIKRQVKNIFPSDDERTVSAKVLYAIFFSGEGHYENTPIQIYWKFYH